MADPATACDPDDDEQPPYEMDEEEEAAFRAAVEEGLAQAEAGQFIPLEKVVAWLESWGREDELPPPV